MNHLKSKIIVLKRIVIGTLCLLIISVVSYSAITFVKAEQSGNSPESTTTSRIKTLSDSLTTLGFGSTNSGSWGDWGGMWNRIYSAATWTPNDATATISDVTSGKTFYVGNNRVIQTGGGSLQPTPTPGIPSMGDVSRIKSLYNSLVTLNFGSDSAGSWGDWGSIWNRIYSASIWTPSDANSAVSNVLNGKTFYAGNNRTKLTGTYTLPTLSGLISPTNNVWVSNRQFCATVTSYTGLTVQAKFVIGGTTYNGSSVSSGATSCYTHTADLNAVTWYAYAQDSRGGVSGNTATWTAKIDTIAPTAPVLTCTNYSNNVWSGTNPATVCSITNTASPSTVTLVSYSKDNGSSWTSNGTSLSIPSFTPAIDSTTNVIMRISDTGGGPINSNTFIIRVSNYANFANQSLCKYENSASPCYAIQSSVTTLSSWTNTNTTAGSIVWKDLRTGLYWTYEKLPAITNQFTQISLGTCPFFSTTPRSSYAGGSTNCGNAINYCATLSQVAITGQSTKTDWYLPTINEMRQAFLNDNMLGFAGGTFAYGTNLRYWSSSEVSFSSIQAWWGGMFSGDTYAEKTRTNMFSDLVLRCVRRD